MILYYFDGWKQIEKKQLNSITTVSVSIIVAVRNEQYTIINLLHCLLSQDYNRNLMEIIVVDDNSTDNTMHIVNEFCIKYKFVRLISANAEGKKNALMQGISNSKCELILTTDADCTMNTHWISSIVNFYKDTNAKMICGPVCFSKEQSVFEKIQSLEFLTLIGSGAGAIGKGKTIMCNGANLCYTRKVYDEVNGFENINGIASGDDVLLMYKIKERYKEGIYFLKNTDAIVSTVAQPNLISFLNQRKRWASKPMDVLNSETIFTAWIVYLVNFFMIATSILFLVDFELEQDIKFFFICIFAFFIKLVVDLIFTRSVTLFFNKKYLLRYYPLFVLFYPIYIVLVPLLFLATGYVWKDRKLWNT